MNPFNDLPKPEPADVFLDLHGSTSAAIAAEELASRHFATWLDAELERLVARWQHLAAPRAKRPMSGDRPKFRGLPRT